MRPPGREPGSRADLEEPWPGSQPTVSSAGRGGRVYATLINAAPGLAIAPLRSRRGRAARFDGNASLLDGARGTATSVNGERDAMDIACSVAGEVDGSSHHYLCCLCDSPAPDLHPTDSMRPRLGAHRRHRISGSRRTTGCANCKVRRCPFPVARDVIKVMGATEFPQFERPPDPQPLG